MPKTYYDSELTGAQIEDALVAINGVATPSNNGKVLYIDNGQIKAASASRWSGGAVLEPLSVTANGDYTPSVGIDGFDSVHVAVPSATAVTIDATLTIEGSAADAKATGDALAVKADAADVSTEVNKREVLIADLGTVSSLPSEFDVTGVETDMVCIKAELSNPYAQTSDWTVSTDTAGKVLISGSINGSTTVKLYLMKSR